MARLRTAMDSAFWDLDVATPRVLEGAAKAVPGEPFPMDAARASRAIRIQQVSFLGNGFPLGIIPSYSPTSSKDLGSFTLQSLLLKPVTSNWWVGFIGQFRPKKLISSIKAEFTSEDTDFPSFKEVAKHVLEKSLYSFGLSTQFSPTPSSFIRWSTEGHGEEKRRRHKMMLFQKLTSHDITFEAAWPQLFIDHKGQYWDVPESISLDLLSLVSESGFRYRLGLHKSSGHPDALSAQSVDAPTSILPGLCAKAAFSYEKSKDFWRKVQTREDTIEKTDRGLFWRPSYDVRLSEPHSAISGIIGGTCAAWFGERASSMCAESKEHEGISSSTKKRSPLNADLFGSVCYTIQHGNFRKYYGDLTRVDARLDISSVSAFAKRILDGSKSSSSKIAEDPNSHPRLNLIFQQQVGGPIVFRLDSRFSLDSSSGKHKPHMEDLICSLTYSFRLIQSGKAVFWYSPKRKEGMVELRVYEF
ncbi:protein TRIGALACTOSYLDIACYLGLYCEROL 4, chloroplastic [Humulus lupulus]|uniref:protein TRIGALACTOSYLDIACYLGLYCEROL 4, chloroplastic n=1 Tax=Humulus lupulus TaxID=3486 RepID=UPI002B40B1CE|nr:protein TRIGALACTOSYLDIACYLGLYCEROL 4, chloroplastic [Humulus lupulus]